MSISSILLVEDHADFAKALAHILEGKEFLNVAAIATSAEMALEHLGKGDSISEQSPAHQPGLPADQLLEVRRHSDRHLLLQHDQEEREGGKRRDDRRLRAVLV